MAVGAFTSGYFSMRNRHELMRSQLILERASFDSHWKDISQFISPRRSRFFNADANRGDKRMNNIIDSTATLAARTLQSGMMAGITSPARPWFRLTTPDQDLAQYGEVKVWLDLVTRRMNSVFLKSNVYNSLPTVYGDMGKFGTGAVYIEEDLADVIRTYTFPIGSYYIFSDNRLKVNGFLRDFRMSVRQLIEKFGILPNGDIDWTNFSLQVKSLWEAEQKETWIDVCHIIEPNPDFNPRKLDSKFKRFRSSYYERGYMGNNTTNYIMAEDSEKYLSIKGYDHFPVLCPRWEVAGEDIYGTNCPGMEALGDVRQLQLGEKRKMQAVEKMINPPMVADVSLRSQKASILPADITYVQERDGKSAFRPAHEVQFRVDAMENVQQQVRSRINEIFYKDLFKMFSDLDRADITATEINAKKEEQLLLIGPVLEQLNQDLLDPLIDVTFDFMVKQGKIPPAPQQLQGQPLRVQYESIMAQAQKVAGIGGIERFANFVGQIAQYNPQILDKVDMDQMLEDYGDITSIPVNIVRSEDAVQAIRAQKAKQAQAEQLAQHAPALAGAAKDLSSSPMDGNNALNALLQQSQAGQATPQ